MSMKLRSFVVNTFTWVSILGIWAYRINIIISHTTIVAGFTNLMIEADLALLLFASLVLPCINFIQIRAERVVGNTYGEKWKESHHMLLFAFAVLVTRPINIVTREQLRQTKLFYSTDVSPNPFTSTLAMLIISLQIIPLNKLGDGEPDILPYCPAITDIFDGIEMSGTLFNTTNPFPLQIKICLAIILFYVPVILETYHLRFPEVTNRLSLSDRGIRLAQLVSGCMFLVFRVLLLANNPHELLFVLKTGIRVYCHFKTLSRPIQRHVSNRSVHHQSEIIIISVRY